MLSWASPVKFAILEKKKQIRREIRQLPPRCVKLFEDETDLLLFPPLCAHGGCAANPRRCQSRGFNARRVVFGTINIDTGHRLFLARQRQRGEDFRAFWESFTAITGVGRSPCSWTRIQATLHTVRRTWPLSWASRLIWLPKRCPELNGMDHLWGHGKDHILANRQYSVIDEEVERFIDYLLGLSNREALKQAGILSENFWLGM